MAVSHNQLPVGADIDHQRHILQAVKGHREHASHRISAYKAGNIGQQKEFASFGDPQSALLRLQNHSVLYRRHIGRQHQRFG